MPSYDEVEVGQALPAQSFPLTRADLVRYAGAMVQHPLASSLVSHAYETGPRRAALGTYNFAGDLGKIAAPAAIALTASFAGLAEARAPCTRCSASGSALFHLDRAGPAAGRAAPPWPRRRVRLYGGRMGHP